MSLKQAIGTIKTMDKTAYTIFLDVKKLYDKARLNTILYVLAGNGVKGKLGNDKEDEL